MASYPTQTTLNAFSSTISDAAKSYADGTRGVPFVIDGDYLKFAVVKMRFTDICREFGLEAFRDGTWLYPTTGGGLAANQASWRAAQDQIYAVTRRLLPGTTARKYAALRGAAAGATRRRTRFARRHAQARSQHEHQAHAARPVPAHSTVSRPRST